MRGTRDAVWFDPAGSDYTARYGAQHQFIHDGANGIFQFITPAGETIEFHDFDQTANPQGVVKRLITASG